MLENLALLSFENQKVIKLSVLYNNIGSEYREWIMKIKSYFILLTCLFTLISTRVVAQVQVLSVHPDKIDSAIQEIHGPNIALYDTSVQSRHKLILMIQGTGGSAAGMRSIDSVFATMGFHVVSIDYKDNVISTVCAHSKDSGCSYRFRREIITGEPLSNKTDVDSVNSILSRFKTFLQYLAKNDTKGGWNKYTKNGKPRWDHIIVAGHSQGSGHAAMLGKMFKVNRVLIFSGPQDYLVDLDMPSPWLSKKSATPENRYFAFLNLNDPFHVKYQIANCKKLMRHIHPDTLMVSPGNPIQGDHHILVNNINTNNPHGSTLFTEFKNVWAYMLGIVYK
jgi:pimeloyl-ACP methyl ester carboxylesterase